MTTQELKSTLNKVSKEKLYVRTPLHGNEFKVCDEITDEVIAIFYKQQDATDYVNYINFKTQEKYF